MEGKKLPWRVHLLSYRIWECTHGGNFCRKRQDFPWGPLGLTSGVHRRAFHPRVPLGYKNALPTLTGAIVLPQIPYRTVTIWRARQLSPSIALAIDTYDGRYGPRR